MGVVWQAVHVVTRKPVALKVLKHSSEGNTRAVQRFLREARAACAVRHPCVVEVHDVLELEDGSPVLVMELLAGETFAQLLPEGPFGVTELVEALARIHDRHVILVVDEYDRVVSDDVKSKLAELLKIMWTRRCR